MNRAWLVRSLTALSVAAACAKATDEELARSGSGNSGGATATGGSTTGGSSGFGGTSGRGGSSSGGTATGGTGVGGGAGTAGEGGATDMGGAGGEGPDPCSVGETPPELHVKYQAGMKAVTEDPEGEFRIFNGTDDVIPLSELSVRYWFHSEFSCEDTTEQMAVNVVAFQFDNPYAPGSMSEVTDDVVALGTGAPGCDAYFALGFSEDAGELAPGQRVSVKAWTQIPIYTGAHDQSNDYSYGACTTAAVYWDRITLYRGSRLVSGREPDGAGGGEGGAGGEGGSGS